MYRKSIETEKIQLFAIMANAPGNHLSVTFLVVPAPTCLPKSVVHSKNIARAISPKTFSSVCIQSRHRWCIIDLDATSLLLLAIVKWKPPPTFVLRRGKP